jgi:biopolymer transport protein ExbD
MAIQGGNEQGGIFAAINITPLTDIFLVLLIIFMVATAITIESAAHVDLPRMQTPDQKQKPKGVTVTYTADHQIYVNQKNVTESQLGPAIHDALSQTTDKVVVFDGDPKVILGEMSPSLPAPRISHWRFQGAARVAAPLPKWVPEACRKSIMSLREANRDRWPLPMLLDGERELNRRSVQAVGWI